MSVRTLRAFTPVLVLTAALGAQVHFNRELRSLDATWVEPPWQREDKWDPTLFKTLSFGHLPAFIDWLWMRSLQDPAYSHVAEGVHPPAFFDLDLATDLDPAFFEAYSDGASHLVVVRDDEKGAVTLLEKGERFRKDALPGYSDSFKEKYWPNSWSLPLLLAYTYLFELEDIPRAAVAFEEAAGLPGSPEYLKGLTERFQKPDGHFEVGLRVLGFMIDGQKDERIKDELERKQLNLKLIHYLHQVNRRFEEYLTKAEKPSGQMEQVWAKFQAESGIRELDPLGGRLHLNEQGKVTTTTPYEPVFGLK